MGEPQAAGQERTSPAGRRPGCGCGCAGALGLVLLFSLFLLSNGARFILSGAVDLAFGWISFARQAAARVEPSGAAVALFALCLALLVAGVHWFASWLQREARPTAAPWRLGASLSLVGGVVLMFVAGTAAVGVAHQVAWLATAGEPLVEATGGGSNEAAAIGALRTIQLAQALFREGDKDRDGRPDFATLDELREAHLVDEALGRGIKLGYDFVVAPSRTRPEERWFAVATPRRPDQRTFFENHAAAIHYTWTATPLVVDPDTCEPPPGVRRIGD